MFEFDFFLFNFVKHIDEKHPGTRAGGWDRGSTMVTLVRENLEPPLPQSWLTRFFYASSEISTLVRTHHRHNPFKLKLKKDDQIHS